MSRILIIEEQQKIRKSLVSVFKQEGFESCDGIEWKTAAELFGRNVYDLIIVDLDVKPPEGYEMLKMIKFSNPGTEVIVVVSPNMYDTNRMAGYSVYDYILKPFRQKDIVAIGKKALEKKHLADRVRNLEQIMDYEQNDSVAENMR